MSPDPGTHANVGPTRRHVEMAVALAGLIAVVAALLGVTARATPNARTTADEPYYLVTAQSLADDGDLSIEDELSAQPLPYHEVLLDEQTVVLTTGGQRLSPHDPLLPLLLAPAMAIGGVAAAKSLLSVLAGLTAALTAWTAIRRLQVRPMTAGIVTSAAFASMPLASYGTQVYPEIPAALTVMIGIAALTSSTWTFRHRVVVILAVVALPWLAIKYAVVAAMLALLALWRTARKDGRQAVLGDVVLLALAGAAYLVVHQRIYGGWTVYAAGDHFVDTGELSVVGTSANPIGRARRLGGLIVDRQFGLAAWAPMWLLGPAAVASLWASRPNRWQRAVVLAPLAAGWLTATFVALTMHGFWSPGRQVVVVLPLAVLAVAVLADEFRPVLAAVLATGLAGAANWLVLAREAATGGPTLVIDFAATAAWPHRLIAPLLPDGMAATGRDDAVLVLWTVAALLSAAAAVRRHRQRRRPAHAPPADDQTTSPLLEAVR